MGRSMSKTARKELLTTIRDRYLRSTKGDKGRILDEFTAVTGLHRKHAIRLLAGSEYEKEEGISLSPPLAYSLRPLRGSVPGHPGIAGSGTRHHRQDNTGPAVLPPS